MLCRFVLVKTPYTIEPCFHLKTAESIDDAQTGVLPWWGERWHKPFFAAFLIAWSVALASPYLGPVRATFWTEILAVLALLSSLATLGRQLPFQNVVAIALLVGIASAVWTVAVYFAFHWHITILWSAILLNARGAAQFIMRRWRNARFYGWGIFVTATTICAIFSNILYSNWLRVLDVALATIIILLISFPLFMNKRPVEPPVNSQPLIVSIALLVWLLIHSRV